ncbi:MAG: hypothetical protein QM796_08220 [Chthoniobacteraceae bacterium]
MSPQITPKRTNLFLFAICFHLVSWLSVGHGQPLAVSMIQLLADPEKFSGKQVLVSGYLHIKFEDHALYLTKEAADHVNIDQCFWVSFTEHPQLQLAKPVKSQQPKLGDLDGCFVFIEGIFDSTQHGHLGSFVGTIREISSVEEQVRWYDGKTSLHR